DGDNDLDLFITGMNANSVLVANLYLNVGSGNFSSMSNPMIEGQIRGSLAFMDLNMDGSSDLIMSGENAQGAPSVQVYLNDGLGAFSPVSNLAVEGMYQPDLDLGDVNGDMHPDLIMAGELADGSFATKLYYNTGSGNFEEMTGTPFFGAIMHQALFQDVDNDNDEDLLVLGNGLLGNSIVQLYYNVGEGQFEPAPLSTFAGEISNTAAFADVDGDNDVDLLLGGSEFYTAPTVLYVNDGNGSFTFGAFTDFIEFDFGKLSYADVDGDDDPDLLITGEATAGFADQNVALYLNDGNGDFTEVESTGLLPIGRGESIFVDLDGDEDLDLFISGETDAGWQSELYTNDGFGNFTMVESALFDGLEGLAVDFGDLDGDDDPDLFFEGSFFENDGNGAFTLLPSPNLMESFFSKAELVDINLDGKEDLFIVGASGPFERTVNLYVNQEDGNFSPLPNPPFLNGGNTYFDFADVNGDLFPDLFVGDVLPNFELAARLYLNDGVTVSLEPSATTEGSLDFDLFPNPSGDGTINLVLPDGTSDDLTIVIYDLLGRPVYQGAQQSTVAGQLVQVSIDQLPSGTYVIQLTDGAAQATKKLVIR
ncbi:MAG: T9SS type A sorting domain-containing protein, partial [Bacteroidota bacterium]